MVDVWECVDGSSILYTSFLQQQNQVLMPSHLQNAAESLVTSLLLGRAGSFMEGLFLPTLCQQPSTRCLPSAGQSLHPTNCRSAEHSAAGASGSALVVTTPSYRQQPGWAVRPPQKCPLGRNKQGQDQKLNENSSEYILYKPALLTRKDLFAKYHIALKS